MTLWIARLTEQRVPYGPFGERGEAAQFAAYLADQVDPADVERLRNPVAELLGWYAANRQPAPARFGAADPADVAAHMDLPPPLRGTRADGHAAGCRRSDPHFFPGQCR